MVRLDILCYLCHPSHPGTGIVRICPTLSAFVLHYGPNFPVEHYTYTMKHKGLTHQIIGCAMEVHNYLGNGFQEVIYQRCLAVELDIQGISFAREVVIPIYYKGRHVGTRRVDFLIEGIISTELKAVISMDDGHLCQGLNYLEAL